jgi:hypothetical protein
MKGFLKDLLTVIQKESLARDFRSTPIDVCFSSV